LAFFSARSAFVSLISAAFSIASPERFLLSFSAFAAAWKIEIQRNQPCDNE
jgi:hypothetical protein